MTKSALKIALVLAMFVIGLATPALAVDTVNAGKWLVYANGLYQQKSYDKAIQAYSQSLRLDNTNAGAYQGLGNCFYGKGDTANALKYYKYSLQLNPSNTGLASFIARLQTGAGAAPAASNGLAAANALYSQRRYSEAVTAYQAVVGANPNDAKAYQGLGNCYYALKDKNNAVVAYRRALQLNPNNTALRSFLAAYAPESGSETAGNGGWGQALWRSALVPGWGQFYNGESTKGLVIGGATYIFLIGAAATYEIGANDRQTYETMKSGDFDTAYNNWQSMANINHIMNIGFYLCYTYNLIDAIWNAKTGGQTASLDSSPVNLSLMDNGGYKVEYRLMTF
jgi:tetratricopeptide (TPR) repeat protein